MDAIAQHQLSLVNNPQFADVLFKVGSDEQEIYAHRSSLSSCPYFNKMFSSGFSEAKSEASEQKRLEIALPDVDADAFLCVLQFIYAASTAKIDADSVLHVLQLSDMYMLP